MWLNGQYTRSEQKMKGKNLTPRRFFALKKWRRFEPGIVSSRQIERQPRPFGSKSSRLQGKMGKC